MYNMKQEMYAITVTKNYQITLVDKYYVHHEPYF